jgi:hypothetical protein
VKKKNGKNNEERYGLCKSKIWRALDSWDSTAHKE